MKRKLGLATKLLAGAVALAVTAPAGAAIAHFTTGNGELFFNVVDRTAGRSYTSDLGIRMNDFLASSSTARTFSPDALLTGTFGATLGSGLRWNVMAGDSVNASGGTIRYLSTTTASKAAVESQLNGQLYNFKIVDNFIVDVNGSDTDAALNVSKAFGSTDPGYFGPSIETWSGKSVFNSAANVGTAMPMYLLSAPGTAATAFHHPTVTTLGTWDLKSNGMLSYAMAGTTPAPVPLPAAAWLMASGLVGLVGVARRRGGGA